MVSEDKKVILITGVLGGIGSKTATLFIEHGWNVIGIDKKLAPIDSPIFEFISADVAEEAEWKKIEKVIVSKGYLLSAIVNDAAVQICKPILALSTDEWDRTMNVNVKSIFLSTKLLTPHFNQKGGAIVNICSVHAMATSPNNAAYAASKGAVLSLTRSMAIELAPRDIRVNAVLPGAIDTHMLREGIRQKMEYDYSISEELDSLGKKHILNRIGKPQEIAQVIWFLISEMSSFITGQSFIVDGGALTKLSTE